MSDIDFEKLSNAELRSQLKKHGLPNVPITDSSRTVLIKKLRNSIANGENNAVPVSRSGGRSKSPSRRETLAAVATSTVSSTGTKKKSEISNIPESIKNVEKTNRRATIAATKDNTIQKDKASVVPPEVFVRETRRRSALRETSVPHVEKITKKTSNALDTIIIEDEDDDDEDLMMAAAANAEADSRSKSRAGSAAPPNRKSRSVSLSKTNVEVRTYIPGMASLAEEENFVSKKIQSNRFEIQNKTTPSTYHTPTNYATGFELNKGSVGAYKRSTFYSSALSNEQSDDTDTNTEDIEGRTAADSPFVSDYVRNLERSKRSSTAGRTPWYTKSQSSRFDAISARPSARPQSFLGAIRERFGEVNKKYRLSQIFAIIIISILLYVLYVLIKH